jgi:hypothetical protein
MTKPRDPKGLEFFEQIAAFVCSEYELAHSWTRGENVYILHVQCGTRDLTFLIEREALDDPGSEEYRHAAEKLLERLVEKFRDERPLRRDPVQAPVLNRLRDVRDRN